MKRAHTPARGRGARLQRRALKVHPAPASARIGMHEWFRMGDHEQVEAVLADLKALGVTALRTGVSWADWCSPEGEAWYGWLLPRLARDVEVLPFFLHTPAFLGIVPKASAPPRDPKWYADFIDQMITLFGDTFEWVELWSEPTNLRTWDVALDPDWLIFSQMVGGAAYWAKHRGKKTVLGGTGGGDPHWVRLMCERKVMQYIDAVGVHEFPAAFDPTWEGWDCTITRVREVLERQSSNPEIWITGTGYSTWRHDERRQLPAFVEAIEAPVQRVYWHSVRDLDSERAAVGDFQLEERECHFGLKRADGAPKLLFRLWQGGGLKAVRDTEWWGEPRQARRRGRPALITGGAGFVGCNLARRLLSDGHPVLLFDNLSRAGVESNLHRLREDYGDLVEVEVADVRDARALAGAVARASKVFHFAAQVAVTTSLTGPVNDFETNARGTLNLLEALRGSKEAPPLVFTSTNKVYGGLEELGVRARASRYEPEDADIREHGLSEDFPLGFRSPYGCSKGTADQYVLDYAHTYDIPTIVFRMSCIYGPHQFGTEDQGWVAHFLIRAIEGEPIRIYGDGKQVRDVLFVEDLVEALLAAQKHMDSLSGKTFNIGGGPDNAISLLELIDKIGDLHGSKIAVRFDDWRPSDQRWYISDTRRFQNATGWSPRVAVDHGIARLHRWIAETRGAQPQLVARKR